MTACQNYLNLQLFPKGVIKKLKEDEQRRLYVILAMIILSLLHGSKANWDVLDSKSEINTIGCGNYLLKGPFIISTFYNTSVTFTKYLIVVNTRKS